MSKNQIEIKVRDKYGDKLNVDDAIIMREFLLKNIQSSDVIIIDFEGVKEIGRNFFSVLFTPIFNRFGFDDVYAKLSVLNIINKEEFKRAYYGTSNINL